MTRRQKILQVLKDIKHESEINPNPEWVEFKFNTSPNGSLGGSGILTDDQEKRILMKMEKDGIIEIHFPDGKNIQEKATLIMHASMYTPTEYMMENDFILIKILQPFYRKYFWYTLTSLVDNKWNYINPFWDLWQLFKIVVLFIRWLWNRSKVITLVLGTLSGLLVYDWSLAWKNLKATIVFLKILLKLN